MLNPLASASNKEIITDDLSELERKQRFAPILGGMIESGKVVVGLAAAAIQIALTKNEPKIATVNNITDFNDA